MTKLLDQYLLLLRDLLGRAVEGVEEPFGLKKRLSQLLRQRYPSELQLPHAYLVLLSHLLKVDPLPITPRQLPNGAACSDSGGFSEDGQIPDPLRQAELGSLWMILGIHLKNETLLYAGLKVALWQVYTLDHRGFPHFSLWNPARSFHPSRLAALNYLLFTLAYRLSSEQGFQQAAQIQKHFGWDPSSLPVKLLNLVPEKMEKPLRLYRPVAEELTVGIVKFTSPQWSILSALSGWNSGVLSYHKNEVAIVNAGPHVGPLDQLEGFGIERRCHQTSRTFTDMIWEKTGFDFRLKGWTKIHALPTWMEIETLFQAQKLKLSCLLQAGRPCDNLSMVFYARCDQITIGGKTVLQSSSIERYQGVSGPLELQSGNEKIYLEPQAEQEMQLIPLAGGDHFWGAHFLIAFPVKSEVFQYIIQ